MSDASVRVIDGRAVVKVGGSELLGIQVAKALGYRNDAAGSAGQAAASASTALTARDAALAASNYFASRSAGEAATAVNGLFSTDDAGELVSYRRTSGGSTEIARTLSATRLASDTGATRVGYRPAGGRGVARTTQAKIGETFSVMDAGAIGDGIPRNSEQNAFTSGAQAVQNPNDSYFSGSLSIPEGIYRLTAPVSLPESFVFMDAEKGAIVWGAEGQNVIHAIDDAFVRSSIRGLRTYGGLDAFHVETNGEVANSNLTDVTFANFTRHGIFTGSGTVSGITSCKVTRAYVDGVGSTNGYGMYCAGINNNNVVSDSDFGSLPNDVFHLVGLTQGWQFRNVRIEGRGQPGRAQYYLEAPFGNHILGGWSEASHEYLLRTTPQTDGYATGVIIDGLVSIGSANGSGGFVGSKFDTGSNRIVLGSNAWYSVTDAPPLCFIYGGNHNLRTNNSVVWTRDTGASFHVVSNVKSSMGTTRAVTIRLKRDNAEDVTANQQLIRLNINTLLVGLNTNGTPVDACIEWDVSVRGIKAAISTPKIVKRNELDGYSTAGVAVTCDYIIASQAEVLILVQVFNLSPTNESTLQVEVDGMSTSYREGNRFLVDVS